MLNLPLPPDSSRAVLAVDPGINGCGVAMAQGTTIWGAEYVRTDVGPEAPPPVRCARMAARVASSWPRILGVTTLDVLVLEWPQVRTAGKGRGDPNDLILLGGVCSAIAARVQAGDQAAPRPRDWKGTIPPDAIITRIQDRLTPGEKRRVRLPSPGLAHNVWDAVGIALWAVGRLDPTRVVARE